MKLFSQRKGLKATKSVIQVDGMDEDLRNGIWNALSISYWKDVKASLYTYLAQSDPPMFQLLTAMWLDHFKLPVDTLPGTWEAVYDILRKHFSSRPLVRSLRFHRVRGVELPESLHEF